MCLVMQKVQHCNIPGYFFLKSIQDQVTDLGRLSFIQSKLFDHKNFSSGTKVYISFHVLFI